MPKNHKKNTKNEKICQNPATRWKFVVSFAQGCDFQVG
jgi:hypothetical protein